MKSVLRYLVILPFALVLLTVALANRAPVRLEALPPDLAALFGVAWGIDLPLYLVLFGGIAVGVLVGFVWEWLREGKHRSAATVKSREAERLARELAMLRDTKGQPQDEVLAILDRRKQAG